MLWHLACVIFWSCCLVAAVANPDAGWDYPPILRALADDRQDIAGLQLCSRAGETEQPLAAAQRLACAAQKICCEAQALAVDMGAGYASAADMAAAELPLLHMLRMNPCEAGSLSGLETAGLERFGLPELRAREHVRFALSFVLEAMLRDDACPLVSQIFPVGEVDEEDLWSVDECYHVLPAQRMHGEGCCPEITHHYC